MFDESKLIWKLEASNKKVKRVMYYDDVKVGYCQQTTRKVYCVSSINNFAYTQNISLNIALASTTLSKYIANILQERLGDKSITELQLELGIEQSIEQLKVKLNKYHTKSAEVLAQLTDKQNELKKLTGKTDNPFKPCRDTIIIDANLILMNFFVTHEETAISMGDLKRLRGCLDEAFPFIYFGTHKEDLLQLPASILSVDWDHDFISYIKPKLLDNVASDINWSLTVIHHLSEEEKTLFIDTIKNFK